MSLDGLQFSNTVSYVQENALFSKFSGISSKFTWMRLILLKDAVWTWLIDPFQIVQQGKYWHRGSGGQNGGSVSYREIELPDFRATFKPVQAL
jgi:hypothetical protein